MTKLLAQELRKSNPLVSIDISEVEKLKEQYASCADDQFAYEGIQRSCPAEKHTLPDGQVCCHVNIYIYHFFKFFFILVHFSA